MEATDLEMMESPPDTPGRPGDAEGGRSGRLQQLLVQGGNLTGSEARVVAALLGLRTGSLKQLSEATSISRSNIYPVMESVAAKGLCQRLPGKFAVWSCPEPKEVLARLREAEEARVHSALESSGRSLEEAGAMFAEAASGLGEPPFCLVDEARLGLIYSEAMESVSGEVLVLNLGPYVGDPVPDPAVLDALARGVKARALWVSHELDAPDGQNRACADAYAAAGVEQRVVDDLPVGLAVIGAEVALLSLPNRDASSPVAAHGATVHHEGLVRLVSAAFEHLWERARPYGVADPAGADLRVVGPGDAEG